MSDILKDYHVYQLKGGEEEAVERNNPVLARREPIVVFGKDGKTKLKIGDGVNNYNDLPFTTENGVGQTTPEGGEIFNDYEGNKANTPYSKASGTNTVAGGKGFNIESVTRTDSSIGQIRCIIKLDSIEGLDVGDEVSASIGNQYTNFAKIISIDSSENLIHLDSYPEANSFTIGNAFLWVGTKPLVGTTYFGFCQSAEGINTYALNKGTHAEGNGTIASGAWGHAEGNGTFAGYSAHAQNRDTKAFGHHSNASGLRSEAHGTTSDAGGTNTKAIGNNSISRGVNSVSGTKAFKVKEIKLAERFEEEIPLNITANYYVSSNGSDENDGISQDTPVASIAKAVELAINNGYSNNDTIQVNLIGNTVVSGKLPIYTFDLVIKSLIDTTKTIITVDSSKLIANNKGATTIYKNVILYSPYKYSSLQSNNSNVIFDNNCEIKTESNILTFGVGKDTSYNTIVDAQTIEINCNSPSGISLSNYSHANRTYEDDINLILNNENLSTKIYLNAANNGVASGTTNYKKNVNLNFKNAKSISFKSLDKVTIDGSLQIINSSGVKVSLSTTGIAELECPKWILINSSAYKDAITFTKVSGRYNIEYGYRVTAQDSSGNFFTSSDGILDLSLQEGEYSIEIEDLLNNKTTITLDTIEGLNLNDHISLKEDVTQNFIYNAGIITEIDSDTNTLVIKKHPLKLKEFVLSFPTYLFVPEKPTVGSTRLGDGSVAIGHNAKSIGVYSYTNGEGTIAAKDYQFVIGKYNDNKKDTVFEIGWGSSNEFKNNLFEVYEDGHAEVQNVSNSDNSIINKKFLDKALSKIELAKIVSNLPVRGKPNTMYLVLKTDSQNQDLFDEYLWVNKGTETEPNWEWEWITAKQAEINLDEYVKNTDLATNKKAGLILGDGIYGARVMSGVDGHIAGVPKTVEQYSALHPSYFIAKGTLENIKNKYVKEGLTNNEEEWSVEEQTAARELIGAIGNEDYATTDKAGLVKLNGYYGVMAEGAALRGTTSQAKDYPNKHNNFIIAKGTLENIKNQYVKEGLTTNTETLTDEEKAAACEWLGAVKENSGKTIVYGTDANGNQTIIPYGRNMANNWIVQRNPDGTIQAPISEGDYHAVNNLRMREYVNNTVGDIETALDNIITKYGLGSETV